MSERRRYQRKFHAAEVTLEIAEEAVTGTSEDLSLGGMKLTLSEPKEGLVVGSKLRVKFELPEVEFPVDVAAEVRWADRIDNLRFGVQFTEGLRAAHVWSLDRL
jgi:c-di-GMP-binding flagellar brake protein YcgR